MTTHDISNDVAEAIEAIEEKQERQRALTAMLKRTMTLRNWLANDIEGDALEVLGDPMKGTLKTSWTGSPHVGWTFNVSRPGGLEVRFSGPTVPMSIRSLHAQECIKAQGEAYGDAKDRLIRDVARSLRLDVAILRTALYQNRGGA